MSSRKPRKPVDSEPSHWLRGARSETGYVRSANEDRMGWVRAPIGDIYVISDGMGGYRGGALAAELIVSSLQESLSKLGPDCDDVPAALRRAFELANEAVYQRRDPNNPDTREMGATAIALITSGERFLVAHVGDSRAYLWTRWTGLKRLTRDHTRAQVLVDRQLLKQSAVEGHPEASLLSRAMGHNPTVEVEVSEWRPLRPGNVLLLCSDGLSGYVSDREISSVLRSQKDPRRITDALIEKALHEGGQDNVTIQVVRYSPPGFARIRAATVMTCAAWLLVVALAGVAWFQREQMRAMDATIQNLKKQKQPPVPPGDSNKGQAAVPNEADSSQGAQK